MNKAQIFENMTKVLGLFAAEHLNYPVRFQQSLNQTKPNGMSQDIIKMLTLTGELILSFYVITDRRVYKQPFESVDIKVHDEKYIPVFTKFLTESSKISVDTFPLFVETLKKESKLLKLIMAVEMLPSDGITHIVNGKNVTLNLLKHAIIKTPFEDVKIYKLPRFVFEDNKFYLKYRFSFMSLGNKYIYTERSTNFPDVSEDNIANVSKTFYKEHYEIITKRLNELYDFSIEEMNNWKTKQFQEYYPILTMERY